MKEPKVIDFEEILKDDFSLSTSNPTGKRKDELINDETTPFKGKRKEFTKTAQPGFRMIWDKDGKEVEVIEAFKEFEPTKDKAESNLSRLNNDVKGIRNFYLKKLPNIKTLESQIDKLKIEITNYKSTGNKEAEKTAREMVKELNTRLTDYKKSLRVKQRSSEDIETRKNIIDNSEEIKALKAEEKRLTDLIKKNTANVYLKRLREIRSALDVNSNVSLENEVIDFDNLDKLDKLNNSLDNTANVLHQENRELCALIGTIIDKEPQEVMEMKTYHIQLALQENLLDLGPLRSDLTVVKNKVQALKSNIYDSSSDGTDTISILHELFDFSEPDEVEMSKARELLTVSYISDAIRIAKSVAFSNSQMHNVDTAISGALYGLTKAVNDWLSMQLSSEAKLSFNDIYASPVRHNARRALRDLITNGASSSTEADLIHKKNRLIDDFIKLNPMYEDFEREFIFEMITLEQDLEERKESNKKGKDGMVKKSNNSALKVTTATDMNAMIGGGEEGVDMFELNDFNKDEAYDPVEAGMAAKSMLQLITNLLNYADISKKDGEYQIKDKSKLFDDIDRKIFMMHFGLDFKKGLKNNDKEEIYYSQTEIADEITEYIKIRDNKPDATFRPSSVKYRTDKIEEKLKMIIDFDPAMQKAVEYLYWWAKNNPSALRRISNSREEMYIKNERDKLREYAIENDADEYLGIKYADGTSLGDVFEVSQDNPFDDEIADLFSELE